MRIPDIATPIMRKRGKKSEAREIYLTWGMKTLLKKRKMTAANSAIPENKTPGRPT
jgi:hypothetical protein